MLKILTSITEYLDFVGEINSDPDFSDPMLDSQEESRTVSDKPLDSLYRGIYFAL